MPTYIDPKDKTEKLSKTDSPRHQFIRELAQSVREDDQSRERWKQKQTLSYKQRLGVKMDTNMPYTKGTVAPVPITDKIIKKLKSLFVAIATQSKKQIVVTLDDEEQGPGALDSAQRIEKALNGLIRKRDFKWSKKISLFVDYFLESGFAFFKVFEKFYSRVSNRTLDLREMDIEELKALKQLPKDQAIAMLAEREGMDITEKDDIAALEDAYKQFKSGKVVIKFEKKIVYSEPTAVPERAIRIIVPAGTTDLATAQRVTHDMWMSYKELKERADKGIYDKKVVDTIDRFSGTTDDSLVSTTWALSEGIGKEEQRFNSSGLFNVRESQTWYLNEDTKKYELWVFTWLEEHGEDKKTGKNREAGNDLKILQECHLPYEHGMFTYVKHDFELMNSRWHASRGVPEQIRGMHEIMQRMYNARIIRDEFNNAPIFRVSPSLGWSGDELQIKPGLILEGEAGQVEQINRAISADISSERIEAQTKAYIEEYMSILDYTITSSLAPKQKTLGEIQMAHQSAGQQINSEVAIFLETLSELANHLYLILKQSVSGIRVIGGVKLTPDDFLVKVNVSWVGSLEDLDNTVKQQRAQGRLEYLLTRLAPAGLVTPHNIYKAALDWLSKDPDVDNPEAYITPPAEASASESEDQMLELLMMQMGFSPQVKLDENHATHIMVMEQYMQSPIGAQMLQANPIFAQQFENHLNVHMQAEQMKNGNTQKGMANDPRKEKVRTTVRGEAGNK